MYSMALVSSCIGFSSAGDAEQRDRADRAHDERARHQQPAPAIAPAAAASSVNVTNHWPAALRSCSVGVFSIFCSAGKSVKTMIQVSTRPAATHRPSSRMGRISLTASAAKPTAVAKIDAVAGDELVGQRHRLVLVDVDAVVGDLDEARVQIDQRRRRGDEDGHRHQRRHDA